MPIDGGPGGAVDNRTGLRKVATVTQRYSFDIETLLNECRPESVLLVGEGADAAVDNYLEQLQLLGKTCRVERVAAGSTDVPAAQRCDMGIVADALERLDKRQGIRLLSRIRDLHTRRFCAAVRIGDEWQSLQSNWSRNDLLALGMMLVNTYMDEAGRRIHLYKYDIATYKPTPRWLNPKDWANPELWNKYRW